MGERLENFWRSRKEEGDLQTTEIPISMLMALDKLAQFGEATAPQIEATLELHRPAVAVLDRRGP